MRVIKYTVNNEYSNRPLLHFLKGHLKISTHIVQSLRHNYGAVIINGKPHRLVDKVFEGDTLELHLPDKNNLPPLWETDLDVIFEDDDILIINKPSGVSVHPTYNHPNGTLCNAVANYLVKTNQENCTPRAVGRLDKVTSGVMIFTKNSFSASRLNGNLEKTYTAVALGKMEKHGTIDAPIYRPDPNKTIRAVSPEGDHAVTHWRLLGYSDNNSYLEIKTETGRTHQIRVHCAYIGHPLLGDEMYGAPVTECLKRAALHCKSVTFSHPVTGEKLTFTATEPDDMKKEIEKANFIVDKPDNIC